ncbi:hypothetical protein EW146_g5409 [Bondarzewia mesenterica]|uniref:GPP34-domain-containing protein n=1 Tax=Bondarzewia mesenterica TaxID=1095465 RepID=A0A4S4LTH2_9AGAM|nr:hypothetical protein EW146_g5409 [Bondarzewia mesenterica]
MSSTGLSRRRVNSSLPSSSNDLSSDSNGHHSNPPIVSSHAGSAFAGGSKVAYDPRDLERDDQDSRTGGKMPQLTIMEEVLLLGLKDRQGYLSFWNDNISYALRGCILIELALRRRIAMHNDPSRRRVPLAERLVEVIDDRQTGETILDETLKMMKAQEVERMSVNSWIDLLSVEASPRTSRKGPCRQRHPAYREAQLLLFDMATHPVADVRTKDAIIQRIVALLTASTSTVPPVAFLEGVQMHALRSVCLVCAAYAASVLDNAFGRLGYEDREAAFSRCDDILAEFSVWPFGSGGNGASTPGSRRREGSQIGMGGGVGRREAVLGLMQEVRKELIAGDEDLGCELVAGVLEVLSKLDSLL